MFWALFRAPFHPRIEAQGKMSLIQAQHLFMPANMNIIIPSDLCNLAQELLNF